MIVAFALVALFFLSVTLFLASRLSASHPTLHVPLVATPTRPTLPLTDAALATTSTAEHRTATDTLASTATTLPSSPPSDTTVAAAPVDSVFVLAMHHSGTSLLTRILMQMGVFGGHSPADFKLQKLPTGAAVDPAKYWERLDVIAANEQLINASCSDVELARQVKLGWITGFGFRASAVADAAQRLFVERMRRVFDSLHSEASDAAIVVKEPRLSLTWPFWRPLIAPRRSVCVVLYRHPFLVAAGLRWRPRNRAMQLDDWLALWEKYTVGTLRACDGMRKVLVSHDALARSPQTTVQEVYEALQAFGVPRLQPVDSAWLRAFLPAYNATPPSAAHDARLSQRQLALWRHLDSGAAVRDSGDFALADSDVLSERELQSADGLLDSTQFESLRDALRAVADAERNVVVIPSNTFFSDLARNQVCSIRAVAPRVTPLALGLDDRFCSAISGIDVPCFYDTSFGVGVSDLARWTLDPTSQYMSILLLKMAYVENAINLGYNVLLADADIAWRGDALAALLAEARVANVDLLIQSDARRNVPEKSNWLCAGFFYLRANERTSLFMRTTREVMLAFGAPDQDVWQLLLRGTGQNVHFPDAWKQASKTGGPWMDAAQLELTYAELNGTLFANGGRFFGADDGIQAVRDAAIVVHANMRMYPKKVEAFTKHGLWHVDKLDVDKCV
jgi:hypothetical protein